GEEGGSGRLGGAAGGGPADEGRGRSGEGADEGVDGGDAFERSVDGDVADGSEEGEGPGEGIGDVDQVERAEEDGQEAEGEAVGEADAVGRHGAIGGAVHEQVRAALEGLIEGAGAAGDDSDSGEGLEEAGVEGADAAAER